MCINRLLIDNRIFIQHAHWSKQWVPKLRHRHRVSGYRHPMQWCLGRKVGGPQARSHGLTDCIRRPLDSITWVVYTTWVVAVISISRGIQHWVPRKQQVVVSCLVKLQSCPTLITRHGNSQTMNIRRVNSQKCD